MSDEFVLRPESRHEKRVTCIDAGEVTSPYILNKALNFLSAETYLTSHVLSIHTVFDLMTIHTHRFDHRTRP